MAGIGSRSVDQGEWRACKFKLEGFWRAEEPRKRRYEFQGLDLILRPSVERVDSMVPPLRTLSR